MAGKIGKALGFSMDLGETPREKKLGMDSGDIPSIDAEPAVDDSDSDMGEDSESGIRHEATKGPASAEEMAMSMFEKASTPAGKVAAMKGFLEACGLTGGSY